MLSRTAKKKAVPLRLRMNFLMIVMVSEKKQLVTDLLLWMTFLTYLTNEKSTSLTVARKFNYICLYSFHIIYPEKSIWRTILSQTNILNIFHARVSPAHVRRIFESVCIRKTRKYIPQSVGTVN